MLPCSVLTKHYETIGIYYLLLSDTKLSFLMLRELVLSPVRYKKIVEFKTSGTELVKVKTE